MMKHETYFQKIRRQKNDKHLQNQSASVINKWREIDWVCELIELVRIQGGNE